MARVAILNSRQSKTPMVTDRWVAKTLEAVNWAADHNHTIIASIGMLTWELVAWQAARRGIPIQLVAPHMNPSERDQIESELLGEEPCSTHCVEWLDLPETGHSPEVDWRATRDRRVIELAEIVIPVSLRKTSSLWELVNARTPPPRIEEQFRIRYAPESNHLRDAIIGESLNPALGAWPDGFLIHWTRASHGPWPGETTNDYLRDFVSPPTVGQGYHRSGLHTLLRIAQEGRLRASSWKIGGGAPMVAFTECSPRESIPLIRWRPRWTRWSFEPYGVAVSREWLASHGGRAVRYVSESEWKSLNDVDRPWRHRRGRESGLWPAEREWRIMGDVELRAIPNESLRYIVRTPEEQVRLSGEFDSEVLSMHS